MADRARTRHVRRPESRRTALEPGASGADHARRCDHARSRGAPRPGDADVPEPWGEREQAFRDQFDGVIAMMCSDNRKDSPEELHDDWVKAYEAMGWTYGPVRDPAKKTHPDMVPFGELEQREQDKDA